MSDQTAASANGQKPAAPNNENDLYELIDRLENQVLQAKTIPFSGNCMVDREELLVLIGMLRDNLPVEIKQARWLLQQNRQVVAEARKDADNLLRQAEKRVAAMIDEHEITLQARQVAAQTLEKANQSARQIRQGSLDYANKRLSELEEQLTTMLVTIQKNKKELK
ncbi:ATP synthase F0 subunit B [Oscillospiraceae bacterium HV4-5-C5C]|nr:ATP synthase F0 subunit B [Oscillospiraceae bacterium HV4-5-C5C]